MEPLRPTMISELEDLTAQASYEKTDIMAAPLMSAAPVIGQGKSPDYNQALNHYFHQLARTKAVLKIIGFNRNELDVDALVYAFSDKGQTPRTVWNEKYINCFTAIRTKDQSKEVVDCWINRNKPDELALMTATVNPKLSYSRIAIDDESRLVLQLNELRAAYPPYNLGELLLGPTPRLALQKTALGIMSIFGGGFVSYMMTLYLGAMMTQDNVALQNAMDMAGIIGATATPIITETVWHHKLYHTIGNGIYKKNNALVGQKAYAALLKSRNTPSRF